VRGDDLGQLCYLNQRDEARLPALDNHRKVLPAVLDELDEYSSGEISTNGTDVEQSLRLRRSAAGTL